MYTGRLSQVVNVSPADSQNRQIEWKGVESSSGWVSRGRGRVRPRAVQGRIAVVVLERSKGGEPEEGGRSSQSQARSERANVFKVTFSGHLLRNQVHAFFHENPE
jgi:hypothetical protein